MNSYFAENHRNGIYLQKVTRRDGLVEKPYFQFCQVLIPGQRDCNLTLKRLSDKGGRSHEFTAANSQDLPQRVQRPFQYFPIAQIFGFVRH